MRGRTGGKDSKDMLFVVSCKTCNVVASDDFQNATESPLINPKDFIDAFFTQSTLSLITHVATAQKWYEHRCKDDFF